MPSILSAPPGADDPLLINPATGTPLGPAPHTPLEQLDALVAGAAQAQQAWAREAPGARAAALERLADLIGARAADLAHLEVQEAGKTVRSVLGGDIPLAAEGLRVCAAAARAGDSVQGGRWWSGTRSRLETVGVGVTAAIVPWNYPLLIACWKLGPAVAAGCACLIKPAPGTPGSASLLADLALEAGLPPGLVQTLAGGPEVAQALIGHPQVALVSFTGSPEVGREVAVRAATALKPVVLELGGKAPMLVFADADLDSAARGAVTAAFINAGQDCTAVARLLVEASVLEPFMQRFLALASQLQLGDPSDQHTDLGPLSSVTHRERVHAAVVHAREQGAQVLLGGECPEGPGAFYPATVLRSDDQSLDCVQREIFGPVVVVSSFSTEEEALAWARGVPYDLAGSVWTASLDRAERLAAELAFGTVWINEHGLLVPEMPHGGVRLSGWGSDMSALSLRPYQAFRHIMTSTDGPLRAWREPISAPALSPLEAAHE